MNSQINPPTVAYVGQTAQPTVFRPAVTAVPDYFFYSIFTMVFCCFPLGFAALMHSCYTRDANLSGQQELARSRSRMAYILNNVALGIGLTIITLTVIIRITIR